MRMWMVDVRYMCDAHLRQEHNDVHAIQRRLRAKTSTTDIIAEPMSVFKRHEALAHEMLKRNFAHNSPLKKLHSVNKDQIIWSTESLAELLAGCKSCRERVLNAQSVDS